MFIPNMGCSFEEVGLKQAVGRYRKSLKAGRWLAKCNEWCCSKRASIMDQERPVGMGGSHSCWEGY